MRSSAALLLGCLALHLYAPFVTAPPAAPRHAPQTAISAPEGGGSSCWTTRTLGMYELAQAPQRNARSPARERSVPWFRIEPPPRARGRAEALPATVCFELSRHQKRFAVARSSLSDDPPTPIGCSV